MSEYAGRIALGGILAVATVVGLSFALNTVVFNNPTTASNSSGLPGCNVLVGTTSEDGYRLSAYLSSVQAKAGSAPSICAEFENLSNETATTYAANFEGTVTNSSGSVVAQVGCGGPNVDRVQPGFYCSSGWNTGAPEVLPAGEYTVSVAVPLSRTSQIAVNATITLTG